MERWRRCARSSPSRQAAPTWRKSSFARPAKTKERHDRRGAVLLPVLFPEEPFIDTDAAPAAAEIPGGGDGGCALFLRLYLPGLLAGAARDRRGDGRLAVPRAGGVDGGA